MKKKSHCSDCCSRPFSCHVWLQKREAIPETAKKQREESAGDMGTEGKATAEEETEIQVFIAASLNTVMTELAKGVSKRIIRM